LLAGRGGVLVEVSNQVHGRLLPIDSPTVDGLAHEVASIRLRGHREWRPDALAAAIGSAQKLWAATAGWLTSADINPLIVTDDGLVAVDALIIGADIDPTHSTT
jgi:hypothetical protein